MTFVHDTICPSCNSSELVEVGGIPSGCYFAGNLISEPMEPSSLFECATCHLFSRIPRLNKLELDELYISALGRDWYSEDKDRTDFTLICSLVELNYPKGGRVLDVGCFDGALLGLLGNAFDKYGIELNSKARALAEERGVSVLGENFDALTSAQEKFDVVLAVDVIEHVHDPFDFMKDLLNVTKSDGLVVVSTGNTDSTSWRFLKSRYWYCAIPEHISFINPRWCERIAKELGLEIKQQSYFAHGNSSQIKKLRDLTANLIYKFLPRFFGILRGMKSIAPNSKKQLEEFPPGWPSARDHMLVAFTRQRRSSPSLDLPGDPNSM